MHMKVRERRGAAPRYWEDVNVGDKLTPVVKGPQTFLDFLLERQEVDWQEKWSTYPSFEEGRASEGEQPRKNPVTGWPYEARWMEHYDFNLCRAEVYLAHSTLVS